MGISVTYLEADALKASAEGGAGRIVPGKSRPSRAREKAYLNGGFSISGVDHASDHWPSSTIKPYLSPSRYIF